MPRLLPAKLLKHPLLFSLLIIYLSGCTIQANAGNDVRVSPTTPTLLAVDPQPSSQGHASQPPTVQPSSTPPKTVQASPTTPLPSPFNSPTPLACWDQSGRMERGSLRDNRLKLPLEYRIHLPPCYDQQEDRRYPVLYIIHGQNYNDDQWDRLGLDEMADKLVAAGDISPFIIVMPRDRSWSQPAEDGFGDAIIETLIPWVDQNYRTLPDRSHRAIGGLSRGAAWAVHLGLTHWELFGALGAHSLPVFWTDTAHIREWLDAIPISDMPRIFMDTGEKDYLIRSTLWFEGVLNQKGIPHEWYLYPGYHEEAYWQTHIEQYVRWYARDW